MKIYKKYIIYKDRVHTVYNYWDPVLLTGVTTCCYIISPAGGDVSGSIPSDQSDP